MKCIKCIKQTKNYDLDEIRRTDNQDAEEKVASGVWKFIAKEEWKAVTRKPKTEQITEESVEQTEKVKSKKQLRKEKIKE
jgi:hypothetical protein